MAHKVGSKGQVVIAKEIRDALGVAGGWLAVQRQVGNHVEIHFLPPEHDRSLAGCLREYVQADVPEEEWDERIARSLAEDARAER